jgi:phosphohistidine phosphatase
MKSLYIMRHGKSDWSDSSGDFYRALADRGKRSAVAIGKHLADHSMHAVVSSPATRAIATAEIVIHQAGWELPLTKEPNFYEATPQLVISRIHAFDPSWDSVLITGHQPTWSDLVYILTGEPVLEFPTAAVACVDFSGVWADVDRRSGSLRWLLAPKSLNQQDPA